MKQTKRQVLPDGLWVVATPIGNLADFAPRGVQALEDADLILCEDTRRSAQLIAALDIPIKMNRLIRLDAHTSAQDIESRVREMQSGKNYALITDAGTPGLSDPGARLVASARNGGLRVTPVPGPSALAALQSVSGFDEPDFCFHGFFPRGSADRLRELEAAVASRLHVHYWFESPQRVSPVLNLIAEKYPEAEILAGKELTKIHERIFFGLAADVSASAESLQMQTGPVGEWVFAVRFSSKELGKGEGAGNPGSGAGDAWKQALKCLAQTQTSMSEAVRLVSQEFGIGRKEVYSSALTIFGKK